MMTFLTRLRLALPVGWYASVDAVLDAILSGLAALWDVLQAQIDDTRLQARLLTATGTWLDGRVADFLPATFQRRSLEQDAPFAQRAAREILRPRATRPALAQLLTDEGSPSFDIFEPTRPADTGGYNTNGLGYNAAGRYGTLLTPLQIFLNVRRPPTGGIANNGGYNSALGYNAGGGGYRTAREITGGVTDTELYDAIARVMPAGVTAWTRLS